MKIAILGYGDQGRSAFEYFNRNGNEITICEANPDTLLPSGIADSQLGANYLHDLEVFDVIVRGPSVHPRDIRDANPDHPEIFERITSNTNEFFKVCPAPIIGVTGTKGKGTTVSLIAEILKAAGLRVHLGGNIGVPPLDMLRGNIKQTDIVVLELANFQLIDLKVSPKTAICLSVTPEHLDWHTDVYEYIHAKQQLFAHQRPNDIAIYNALDDLSEEVATVSPGIMRAYEVPPVNEHPTATSEIVVNGNDIEFKGQKVCSVHDVKLLGRHNLENVCAAIAATWELVNQNKKIIKQVLQNISLPHRLEVVREHNGITFVNDSFGTTPAAAVAAIKSFQKPIVLITGGSSKGVELTPISQAIVANNVKYVIALGDTGPQITSLLDAYKQVREVPYTLLDNQKTMADVINTALQYAQKGDVVLLAPGCASFGMFKNYKERGEQFQHVVRSLT